MTLAAHTPVAANSRRDDRYRVHLIPRIDVQHGTAHVALCGRTINANTIYRSWDRVDRSRRCAGCTQKAAS